MIALPQDRMDQLLKRFSMIESQMANNPDSETYVKLASEYSELQEVVGKIRELTDARREAVDLAAMRDDAATDAEMRALALEELPEVEKRIGTLEQEVQILLLPKDAADEKNAILEIRAGTGGLEAALFAGDLFRMYERYAAEKAGGSNWSRPAKAMPAATRKSSPPFRAKACSPSSSSNQACTACSACLKRKLAGASIHRLRQSRFCRRPRTSISRYATKISASIRCGLRAGGQHVNTTDSAVRITHIPTGIMVVQAEKSQHQNRARAMQILRARLYDMERQKAETERSESRRSQVGSGDRSERIRTYNFPQGRVTDHRINLTLYKLDRVMEGDLDELVDALISDHQTALLTELGQ